MNDLIQHVEYRYKVIFHYKHPDHDYILNRCHYFKFYDVYDDNVNKRMYERVAHYSIDEFYKNALDNEVLVAFEIVIEDKYISPVLIHEKEGEQNELYNSGSEYLKSLGYDVDNVEIDITPFKLFETIMKSKGYERPIDNIFFIDHEEYVPFEYNGNSYVIEIYW